MELEWLCLESKYLEESRKFYSNVLDLDIEEETPDTVSFEAGDCTLRLKQPSGVPRGGVHTHYAFSTAEDEYGDWLERVEEVLDFSPVEHDFGNSRSMYFYDPDRHCVEIDGVDREGDGITGIFEVVLEVEDLEDAVEFYEALGGSVIDDSEGGKRVRLSFGGFDLELWEPRLGIADGQGGLHVDFGVSTEGMEPDFDYLRGNNSKTEEVDEGVRYRDRDGHYVTLC